MDSCPNCGEYQLWKNARCPCRRFDVAIAEHDICRRYDTQRRCWLDEIDDIEWRTVYATEPQRAAEKAVEIGDQDACEGISNTSHVIVRDSDDQIHLFVVQGEMVPEYWANDHDRWEFRATQQADQILQHLGRGFLPDDKRPQTRLPSDYYSPEKIRERRERDAERR